MSRFDRCMVFALLWGITSDVASPGWFAITAGIFALLYAGASVYHAIKDQ